MSEQEKYEQALKDWEAERDMLARDLRWHEIASPLELATAETQQNYRDHAERVLAARGRVKPTPPKPVEVHPGEAMYLVWRRSSFIVGEIGLGQWMDQRQWFIAQAQAIRDDDAQRTIEAIDALWNKPGSDFQKVCDAVRKAHGQEVGK